MGRSTTTKPAAAIARAVALAIVGLALTAGSAPAQNKHHGRRHGDKVAAAPSRSLEARHEVCLAFIRRHGLSCDPWTEPTCGGDLGYFRPMECVRPRSQQ